jgi:hypothetical protein
MPLNTHNYKLANTYYKYDRAKKRKLELKAEGFRVKIDKNNEGLFDVWIKDVFTISLQQDQGNGRKR